MKTVYCIGEALIDFIPSKRDCLLKDVPTFTRVAGGAPTNVCSAVAKLGGNAALISKLGLDAFGDHIIDALKSAGVDTTKVSRTSEANTALAFVSLRADGERDFSFYRKPSADMLLSADEIGEHWFKKGDCLHFCSVDLVECPMKYAHKEAIQRAEEAGAILSFDPNVRLPLWENEEDCRQTILEFLPHAHILKISEDEIFFLTGCHTVDEARDQLFQGNVQVVLLTRGKDGAELHTKDRQLAVSGGNVQAVDTTGAGDAFTGAFLYLMTKEEMTMEQLVSADDRLLARYLTFANTYAEYSTRSHGAIPSYATLLEFAVYMEEKD